MSFSKLESNHGKLITHTVYDNIMSLIDLFASNFDPDDTESRNDTSFYSIRHLCERLSRGELTEDFRVVMPDTGRS